MSDTFDDGIGLTDTLLGDLPEGLLGDTSARVVSARGTEDGLILRIDGRAAWEEILSDLDQFLGGRKKFFEGGEVAVEWLERLPTKEQSKELEQVLRDNYGIEIVAKRKRPPRINLAKDNTASKSQQKKSSVTVPLFDEMEGGKSSDVLGLTSSIEAFATAGDGFTPESRFELGRQEGAGRRSLSNMTKVIGDEVFYEDDANAKVVFGTLRSGQRYETPFSLIVIGDVNPGADLVAGGDIIVLGSLRGTAHASAYDDDSFDRVIFALQMQPMQLRIGSVISRGSDEVVKGAEIARIENRRIIVEPFNARGFLTRKHR